PDRCLGRGLFEWLAGDDVRAEARRTLSQVQPAVVADDLATSQLLGSRDGQGVTREIGGLSAASNSVARVGRVALLAALDQRVAAGAGYRAGASVTMAPTSTKG